MDARGLNPSIENSWLRHQTALVNMTAYCLLVCVSVTVLVNIVLVNMTEYCLLVCVTALVNMTAYCLLVCVRDSSTTRYDSELTVPFDLLVCSAVTKVSGASVQCDVARVEWSRRHCTSADGLDWRQGSLSQ